jgi:hypothetical protein
VICLLCPWQAATKVTADMGKTLDRSWAHSDFARCRFDQGLVGEGVIAGSL